MAAGPWSLRRIRPTRECQRSGADRCRTVCIRRRVVRLQSPAVRQDHSRACGSEEYKVMSYNYFRVALSVLLLGALAGLSSSASAYEAVAAGVATGATDSPPIASAIQFADSADG